MTNTYDRIAGIYDTLSRLVFGKSIVNAQLALLPQISAPCKLLIVGGGTGWILDELAKVHVSGLDISYVEISAKMILLAKKRNVRQNKIHFIHMPIEDFESNETFDVVMTPFLFDNFAPERAEAVFLKLHKLLIVGGTWLFVDFHIENQIKGIWQKALLQCMYWFFKTVCNVEASTLPDMESHFQNKGYIVLDKSTHFQGFIQSIAYQKVTP
ncbi:class I SAM-dependent methyltransferase [Dyadobacter sp. CY326]|uniref:class I SAM-dependent methyltransferase n=1 Tax=Dyadobacter sp. CY326 TaxID=2907300 RepID=UPI001F1EBF7C|nr:class I SAM-dependent methyltransferase [Dyadobacter sp. CY326]MCE7064517.1 class I SAM-dependent methyltransferase [Dyadobacter sp. CY326]